MDEVYAKRSRSICLLVVVIWMALVGQVSSDVFDDMQEKRAFPDQRGKLALKRSALDTVELFNDRASVKRAFEDIETENLNRIQNEVEEARANLRRKRTDLLTDRNEPDTKRAWPDSRGLFQSKRVVGWPEDRQIAMSDQQDHPTLKRGFSDTRGLMSEKRRAYQIERDYLDEKRTPWSQVRGELGLKRQSDKRGYPDNTQGMFEEQHISY